MQAGCSHADVSPSPADNIRAEPGACDKRDRRFEVREGLCLAEGIVRCGGERTPEA
jgi:hypothetical protein